jgi:hypothetical protein
MKRPKRPKVLITPHKCLWNSHLCFGRLLWNEASAKRPKRPVRVSTWLAAARLYCGLLSWLRAHSLESHAGLAMTPPLPSRAGTRLTMAHGSQSPPASTATPGTLCSSSSRKARLPGSSYRRVGCRNERESFGNVWRDGLQDHRAMCRGASLDLKLQARAQVLSRQN